MTLHDIRVLAACTGFVLLAACGPGLRRERDTAAVPHAREGWVTTSDGVRLHYRQVGTRGDTLVFLHGGPGGNYEGVGPDLQPLGERHVLIMYEQRGAGRSDAADTTTLTAATHVGDLEAVRRHFGIGRMTLAGHSWGTGLAALYAVEYPEHVSRLLLLAPMPPAREPYARQRSEAVSRRRQEIMDATGLTMTASIETDPVEWCRQREAITHRLYHIDTVVVRRRRGSYCAVPPHGISRMLPVQRATLRSVGDWDFRPLLRRLAMRALVIEGAESVVPLDQVRLWARELPNARVLLVPGSGHGYQAVERSDVFFPAVERFLRGEWPEGVEVATR